MFFEMFYYTQKYLDAQSMIMYMYLYTPLKYIWFQNLKGTSNFIKSFFFDIIVKELKKKSNNKINIFLL